LNIAGAKSDFLLLNAVRFIPLPKIKNVDEIDDKDIEKFVTAIKNEIEIFIENYLNGKFLEIEKLTEYVKKHSYSKFFSRLTNIYKISCKK